MKRHEVISSLIWMGVGLLFLTGSIRLGTGRFVEPGAGFFPFVMAICLISFSLIHFISSLMRDSTFTFSPGERFWPKGDGIRRIGFTLLFLFAFLLALNDLGFVFATFLFMFVILRFVEPQKWLTVLLVGSITTLFSYSIFQLWLKSNLPAGILGF